MTTAAATVRLEPIEAGDFAVFADHLVPAYVAAMVAAGEWAADTSLDRARADVAYRLPQGVKTAGHSLLAIRTQGDGRHVGDLWLQYRPEAGQIVCVVLDIFIMPRERRRGYARAALLVAETLARTAGIKAMRLTVLGDNQAARCLYDGLGYDLLNARLAKPLI